MQDGFADLRWISSKTVNSIRETVDYLNNSTAKAPIAAPSPPNDMPYKAICFFLTFIQFQTGVSSGILTYLLASS